MQKALRPSSIVPSGFAVISASNAADGTTIIVRSTSGQAVARDAGPGVPGSIAAIAAALQICPWPGGQ